MITIASFPRSGNTFYRTCLEFVFRRPTLGCDGSAIDTPIYKRLGWKMDDETPLFRKVHFGKEINPNEKTIYLFRNPFEAILSHKKRKSKKTSDELTDHYMGIVQAYDNHPRELCQIVLYENIVHCDLLGDELLETAEFIGMNNAKTKQNIAALQNKKTFDFIMSSGFKAYQKTKQKQISGKSDLDYHRRCASRNELYRIVNRIDKYPKLRDLYVRWLYEE